MRRASVGRCALRARGLIIECETGAELPDRTGRTSRAPDGLSGSGGDAWLAAAGEQVSRYWSRYRLVLVTTPAVRTSLPTSPLGTASRDQGLIGERFFVVLSKVSWARAYRPTLFGDARKVG